MAVPSLVGKVLTRSLVRQLHARGLIVRSSTVPSARRTRTILHQRPVAGARVPPGTIVRLTIARARPHSSTSPAFACPSNPLLGVYHAYRLQVLGACRWYQGTVVAVRPEIDGDHHVDIRPDPGYGGFLDGGDLQWQHGGLLVEPMPGQRLPIPEVGEHVRLVGTWVFDRDHGWNEIHPVWAIRYGSEPLIRSIPPATPLYHGGGDGGGSGGGGGSPNGGKCDLAYPGVCIPPPPPDLDCGDITYRNFKVLPPDPHGFDGDHDGIGCET